eukprot:gene9847-8758_t
MAMCDSLDPEKPPFHFPLVAANILGLISLLSSLDSHCNITP